MSSRSATESSARGSATPLQVYLLGPPRVEWAGHPLSIPRRQARALLYRLAAHLEPVPREQLCFLFWPDTPESSARLKLSRLLAHLKLALPEPDVVLTPGDQVELAAHRTWSDTTAFERLRAVDLYRGPFLAGFSLPDSPEFEAWADTTTIVWTAGDADGDELRFMVLYSPDGGAAWSPLAFDVPETSLEVDTTSWAGSDAAQVQVLASDGFNTTAAESGVFQVPRKAPRAWIYAPEDGAVIHPYEALVLAGHGEDPEDGELAGSSLVWTADGERVLGTGDELFLPGQTLPAGVHTITLTARDSDGQMRETTVRVLVGRQVFLPLISR